MNQTTLEARHVSRAFGPLKAVCDVSLVLEAGQVCVLLGRSGSGKSTFLRMLAGLERLDAGEILLDGHIIADAGHAVPAQARGLGMVFQDYALFPHLTALGNVAFGLHKLGSARAEEIAAGWLDKVGLSHRARAFPHMLSGGEQQRVALARALAPEPKAVLMDEPFSGLDPHMRADLQSKTLEALRQAGVGAIVVSHDTGEALAIADSIAIMDHGHIIQAGKPQDVYQAPRSLEAARALGPVWTIKAQAAAGEVHTPLGTYATPLTGPVILAGRPESCLVTPHNDGPWQATEVRGVGRFVTLRLALRGSSDMLHAQVEADRAWAIGECFDVALAPQHAFVFPASTDATPP